MATLPNERSFWAPGLQDLDSYRQMNSLAAVDRLKRHSRLSAWVFVAMCAQERGGNTLNERLASTITASCMQDWSRARLTIARRPHEPLFSHCTDTTCSNGHAEMKPVLRTVESHQSGVLHRAVAVQGGHAMHWCAILAKAHARAWAPYSYS